MPEFEYDPKMGHVNFFNVNFAQFSPKYDPFGCRVDPKMVIWPIFVKLDPKFAIPLTGYKPKKFPRSDTPTVKSLQLQRKDILYE